MQVLVRVLKSVLPNDTEYVVQTWGAVYFSARGIRVPDDLKQRLEDRGFEVEIFNDDVSRQVRVELKDMKRELKKARDFGAQAARDHYKNTQDGEYVPESPMEPDYVELKDELGHAPSGIEVKAFEEKFKECAEDYNVEVETYGSPSRGPLY